MCGSVRSGLGLVVVVVRAMVLTRIILQLNGKVVKATYGTGNVLCINAIELYRLIKD